MTDKLTKKHNKGTLVAAHMRLLCHQHQMCRTSRKSVEDGVELSHDVCLVVEHVPQSVQLALVA